jgi:intracellular septation protein
MHADEPQQVSTPIDVTIDSAPIAPGPKGESWLPMALDFGPLLAWFLAYHVAKRFVASGPAGDLAASLVSTGVFMAAILIALLVSKLRVGRVSPMLWLSAVLVVFFGALTLYFHDTSFIMAKPTYVYGFFALMLLGGWAMKRPLMRYLLQSAYDGLDETGWLKLSRNWGLFFVALAMANEVMRHTLSYDVWLAIKVWGITVASVLFGAANIPMLLRHGLNFGEEEAEKKD